MDNVRGMYGQKEIVINSNELNLLARGLLPPGWKQAASSKYAWVALKPHDPHCYFKKFLPRSRLEGIKALFQGSRARRFVRETRRLQFLGFGAPDVIAWDRSFWSILMGGGWVLTRGIDGLGVFDYWCGFMAGQHINIKRSFLTALAREIAKLHNSGVVHGDLRLNNILVVPRMEKWDFIFLDNERNQLYNRIPWKYRCKNLVQMNMTEDPSIYLSDRLFFFKAYCKESDLTKSERKRLFRDVAHRTSIRKKDKCHRDPGIR